MLTLDNFHMVSFVLQEFTDGISAWAPIPRRASAWGSVVWSRTLTTSPHPRLMPNFRRVIIALVGQNLRDTEALVSSRRRCLSQRCDLGARRWRRSVSVCHRPPVRRTPIDLAHGFEAAGNDHRSHADHRPCRTFDRSPDPLDQPIAVSDPARVVTTALVSPPRRTARKRALQAVVHVAQDPGPVPMGRSAAHHGRQ